MAHIARLGALTEELVTLITSTSPKNDPARFSAHRESALRALRNSNYLRTNQFDVYNQLEGLDEKFRVYDEDDLADALKKRVDYVQKSQSKWNPEILHLLLELSDRPLINSKVKDLDLLRRPDKTEPPLRWKDLIAEDPLLREKRIWQNVDFAAESSDDGFEDSASEGSELTEQTTQSSVDQASGRRLDDYIVDVANRESLLKLRDTQFWLKNPSVGGVKLDTVKKSLTELQAIREVLFMLSGMPTSLFETQAQSDDIKPSKSYALKHCSHEAFYKIIRSFAEQGSTIKYLRSWAQRPQSIPLLQVFQGSILTRVANFDRHLSQLQAKFLEMKTDLVISLVQIQAEIATGVDLLLKLSSLVKILEAEPYAHAFRYLEMLFDETCIAQMIGEMETYEYLGTIFFECFQVYLRPIRVWMEEGELSTGDKVFFISGAAGEIDLVSIWQSRFKLLQTQDGVLHAPKFLRAAASKIFTTGKSVVVLKQLNQFSSMSDIDKQMEPRLNFDAVCGSASLHLAPFNELFDEVFATWIQSKHQHASTKLQRILFDSCGLHTSLEALWQIYFMADGACSSAFTYPLFDKLDTLDTSWSDRFTLTELCSSAFGHLPSVNIDRLRTKVLPLSQKNQDISKCRKTVKVLAIIELQYRLPWPIQIIVTPAAIAMYQRIFTFLFQLRRSSHILTRQRLVTDLLTTTSSSDERALYYSLRNGLQWFVQALYYYITCLVLEPASLKIQNALKEAVDIDTMIEVHSTYIKSTVGQALLGAKLGLIHKTILKTLDLAIKLEDAQAANASASKEANEQQQNMMDMSMASLGLHTPQKFRSRPSLKFSRTPRFKDESSDEDEDKEVDVDLSIFSMSMLQDERKMSYAEQLRDMKEEFERAVRFVSSGLRGVARAGLGDEARNWDLLAETLELGFGDVAGMSRVF
ncbi:hypothetical protein HYALB_00005240 [Hymenoscyphus albidus]|uniref:Spindle pole body component n=1 Tax=Hymenoscyphus albidus TaxID=595503 RepID=A0A9N9LS77_9HELO|nr:hypothetical protein HYALB_00005240 [Hymenoscyphus albidus]